MTLVSVIVAGGLAPGDVLAPAAQLGERHTLGPSELGECVALLERRGLVTLARDGMVTVSARECWDLFALDVMVVTLTSVAAMTMLGGYLECRRIVETDAAGLAAQRASVQQVEALERQLEALRSAALHSGRAQELRYHEAATAFHLGLLVTTGNDALVALVGRIDAGLRAARYPRSPAAYRRTLAVAEHESILAAVRVGDADGARAAMRAHRLSIERYLREHARKVAMAT